MSADRPTDIAISRAPMELKIELKVCTVALVRLIDRPRRMSNNVRDHYCEYYEDEQGATLYFA